MDRIKYALASSTLPFLAIGVALLVFFGVFSMGMGMGAVSNIHRYEPFGMAALVAGIAAVPLSAVTGWIAYKSRSFAIYLATAAVHLTPLLVFGYGVSLTS